MFKLKMYFVVLLLIFTQPVWAMKVGIFCLDNNSDHKIITDTFLESIKKHDDKVQWEFFFIDKNQSDQELLKTVFEYYPDVNLAVGEEAATFCKSLNFFPFVFVLVKNPVKCQLINEQRTVIANGTGIEYFIPLNIFFSKLKTVLPRIKTLGVLKGEDNSAVIKEAKPILSEMGIQLKVLQVDDSSGIYRKFRNLCNKNLDVFWFLPDDTFIASWNTDYLFNSCKNRNLPMLTHDFELKPLGASIIIYPDFKGLAKQAAKIAVQIKEGKSPASIPLSAPEEIGFFLDSTTNHLK